MNGVGTSAIDIAHLRSWIGREDVGADILSEDLARKYHATFDFAGEAPTFGAVMPPLIHFCLAGHRSDLLGPDGDAQHGGFLPSVPMPRRPGRTRRRDAD